MKRMFLDICSSDEWIQSWTLFRGEGDYDEHQLFYHLYIVDIELDVLHDIRTTIDNVLNAHHHSTSSLPPSTTTASVASTSQTETTTSLPSSTTTSDESSTTSLTTIVTSISGQLTTYMTNMPTSTSDSGSSDVNRTALIAGVITAAVVLAALALGAVFIYKRAQKRRIRFMEAIKRIRREGKGAGAVRLLNDEFEDTTHQRYRDLLNMPVSISRSMPPPSPPASEPSNYSTASLVRGDSGSMFREEVWPPPCEVIGHSREPSIEEVPFRAIMPSPLPPGAAQLKKPSPLSGD
ncbi:hypothetical protein F5146DRAFT_1193341 [Armillaria mellea]|nr:hypothetical protein F5146DRAFT_1193341 [Armillaria mellea]